MRRSSILLIPLMLLCACEVGPDYERPAVETPSAYKEAGAWLPIAPADAADHGPWWQVYKDPVLDNLEQQIDISNQNLKAAEAAYRESTAIADETRATLFPTLTAGTAATRSGNGANTLPPVTNYSLSTTASWAPDVWGRIRRSVESSEANAQASAADLASARLSAQASLATNYFDLRMQDRLQRLLDSTVDDDTKALKIVKFQYESGVAAKADVLAAQTQLESVQAQAINTGVARAQLEHAIAVLVGKPPSEFSMMPGMQTSHLPDVPVGLPSTLLQRRPDIASSERAVIAANAQVGGAVSAWFPNLTISGSYGFAGVFLPALLEGPASVWTYGPALTETIFDAGAREAAVEQARATYDESVASYRQTVLTAFQQVEDNLAALRILAQEAKAEDATVTDARKSEELTLNQYKQGIVPYSSVLTAQTTTLSNEQTALTVEKTRYEDSVALIQALGGGWDVSQLPQD